jgi:hypothetical protein
MLAPNAASIQSRLEPATAVVAKILGKSIDRAGRFFKVPGRQFCPNTFATLVRFEARGMFKIQQLDSSDDDDEPQMTGIETQTLPNIGLQLFHDGILAKILKASPGAKLPMPTSTSRIAYYDQHPRIVHERRTNSLRTAELNTVYLWDCDEHHKLSSLALVCPSRGGWNKSDNDYFWSVPIPLKSSERHIAVIKFGEPMTEAIPMFGDLPITRAKDHIEFGINDAQ